MLSRAIPQLDRSDTRGGQRRDVHCRAVSPAADGPLEWLLEGLARHADAKPGVLEGRMQRSLERLVRFPAVRHDNNTISGRTYAHRTGDGGVNSRMAEGRGGSEGETAKGTASKHRAWYVDHVSTQEWPRETGEARETQEWRCQLRADGS